MPDAGVTVDVSPRLAAEPERIAVVFARRLRARGLDVPVGSMLAFAQALAAVGLGAESGVYWAGRATLVRRQEDVAVYDEVFQAMWRGVSLSLDALLRGEEDEITIAFDADGDERDDSGEDGEEHVEDDVLRVRFSARETLATKDFAVCTASELDETRRLMADMRLVGALRRSRRLSPSKRPTNRPDLRRTLRAALRAGGEPIDRRWRRPSTRPRRLVLLLDVSGSMEPYARAFVRFLHAAVVGRGRVEAFALGTRLTRLTRELSQRDPDLALRAAGQRVVDWSGGTRLGDGLRRFNDEWGQRGMARGADVIILSDGWDRGDPEVMAEQMARLKRLAHRIIWVNPLKATEGYAPLARGMAAALPFVDEFVEGHSLRALDELARLISTGEGR